jgi:hypothetical protein
LHRQVIHASKPAIRELDSRGTLKVTVSRDRQLLYLDIRVCNLVTTTILSVYSLDVGYVFFYASQARFSKKLTFLVTRGIFLCMYTPQTVSIMEFLKFFFADLRMSCRHQKRIIGNFLSQLQYCTVSSPSFTVWSDLSEGIPKPKESYHKKCLYTVASVCVIIHHRPVVV